MDPLLAPVKCIVQERDPRLDVKIIRKDRAIMYKVEARKIMDVRKEIKLWNCPAPEVRKLIQTALGVSEHRQDIFSLATGIL
jgi:hypothetical protein